MGLKSYPDFVKRLMIAGLLLAGLVGLVWGQTAPAVKLDGARRADAAGELMEAEATVREVLRGEPGSVEAMYLLGHILERRKEPRESLEWFTRAAKGRAPTAEDLRVVGLDYVLLNDAADAVHWLERSVALDAGNSEAWYDLGRARMAAGNYTGAEEPLKRALALRPGMVKAANNLGLVYEAKGRADAAAAAYRQAIGWQEGAARPAGQIPEGPISEQPLLNYGALLTSEQRGKEAVGLLERAVAIAPRDARCHEELGRALDQAGERGRAAVEMERAVALDPKNPRLHFQLGQIYRRAGEAEKAKAELRLSGQLYGEKSSEPGEPRK